MKLLPRFLLGLLASACLSASSLAAGFIVGDFVVVRVGTGAGPLTDTGNAVFLDEYTPAGVLVQSIALPTATSGANRPLVLDGTASSEGALARSVDGRYLVLTGYGTSPGGAASLSTTTAATVNRIVARIDGGGIINTTTALTDFASAGSPRSVATADGTTLYLGGSNSGVRLASFGATSSSDISTTVTDVRTVEICVGQLYVSTVSGALRIGTVGSGLPTTGGQTIANLPGFPTTGSPQAFFLLDLDATVAGSDTLYLVDDVTQVIQKYCLSGGNWVARGTSFVGAGVRGLTATSAGGTVTLYATTPGALYRIADSTGYDGTLNGAATAIATAPAGTVFRGIAVAPVAPPAIVTPPAAQSAVTGGSATFTVAATGSETLTYRWRRNTTPLTDTPGRIAGATTATLTLSNLAVADTGTIDVVVTNPVNPVTSTGAALTVAPQAATVTLGSLNPTYTGAPLPVTATTSPAGVSVALTYDGSGTAPTNAGSYAVVATITDPNYSGTASGTLVIARAPATISLGNLNRAFDGNAQVVTVTTTPVGLPVSVTYNGSAAPPSASGSYAVVATITDPNFSGTANGTLQIGRAPATITLSNLTQAYNGTPRPITATVTPNVATLRISYSGDANPPTNAGSYAVLAIVEDPLFSGIATATLVVTPVAQTVSFSPWPPFVAGSTIGIGANTSSGLPVTLSVVSGNATINSAGVTFHDTAPVTLRATQAGNQNYTPAFAELTLAAQKSPQSITFAPLPDRPADAGPLTLNATASSGLPISLTLVSGPASLVGNVLTLSGQPGTVVLRASQSGNALYDAAPAIERSITITPATPAPAAARVVNFSTRALAGTGDQLVIAGFVITGAESKQVLLRAIGPGLRAFGVGTALAAPRLELRQGSTLIASNTGWSTAPNAAEIAATAARSGAFPLAAGSADAVILATLPPGAYTALVTAASGAPGAALVEVYDLSAHASAQRIANFSTRALAGSGDNTLITGLVVEGTAPRRFLVRAAGPALRPLGVASALARPELTVRASDGTLVARNASWVDVPADVAGIVAATLQVGAFPFLTTAEDSAMIVTLAPGAYTAQVTSRDNATGTALVEIYELP